MSELGMCGPRSRFANSSSLTRSVSGAEWFSSIHSHRQQRPASTRYEEQTGHRIGSPRVNRNMAAVYIATRWLVATTAISPSSRCAQAACVSQLTYCQVSFANDLRYKRRRAFDGPEAIFPAVS